LTEREQLRIAARRIVVWAADWHVRFLTALVERGDLTDDQADALADVWDRDHAPRLAEAISRRTG
jgi:hypothetical protein